MNFIRFAIIAAISLSSMTSMVLAEQSQWRYLSLTKAKTIDQIVKSGRFKKYGIKVCAPKEWEDRKSVV